MTPSEINVLVVDDVQTVRIQVKELLRMCGFDKVKTAPNGLEALNLLNEEPFQLVVADLHMNPITGIELIREIRSKESLKNISIVMLTAEGTKEKVVEVLKTGVDDYIMKPLTKEHVQLKVLAALMKRKWL